MTRTRVADILAISAYVFQLPLDRLKSHQRFKPLCRARFACYYVAREQGHSFPAVGRVMDRDHSTVLYGARQADMLLERDEIFRARVKRVRELSASAKPFVAERMAL